MLVSYKDRMRKNEDMKGMKRKFKKAEKDAVRELRKDTVQIQVQKDKENLYKKKMFRKNLVNPG